MVFPPRKQIVVPPSKITARTHDEIARQAPNHLATPVTGFKHVKHRVAKRGHIRGRGGSERYSSAQLAQAAEASKPSKISRAPPPGWALVSLSLLINRLSLH
jgi:hypothetical protein